MRINLFVDYPRAPKFQRVRLAALVRRILKEEKKSADSINLVLVGDEYLLEVNRKFLNHNYRTDVISFDLAENSPIEGEIYVSVDRARVQARRYKVPLEREVLRLMVHGVLHLCGWVDKTRSQKLKMRKRENTFIEPFFGRRAR